MDLKAYFSSLPTPARFRLFVGIGAILLLTAGLLWWALAPRQQLLFGNLREPDAAEIVQSLNTWKVPHGIADGGSSVTVPADLVYETRMRLVSAGIPKGGHVGFELFDNSDFGVTEFAQRVNYQRALQGEIERTIASLPSVETARVHLTIRRPGLFVGEHESSKASVALTLRPGETLSRQQVNGIRSLVAAAVEGLSTNAVSVLDSNGALLAAASNDGAEAGAGADEHSEQEARIEERIRTHVTQLLGQVLHDEEFRVSVDATLNFDSVHEVNERPLAQGNDGNGLVVRKRVNSTDAADASGKKQSQEETEYVHGTAHEEISRAPGRLERLSVAVILPPNVDEFQMTGIQTLVAAAAGIDPKRGDRLEVSRMGRASAWHTPAQATPTGPANTLPLVLDASPTQNGDAIDGHTSLWLKVLPILAIVLLVGTILFIASQNRSRPLQAGERDAVLAKLRGWLAEGTRPS
jgi:flagellar M-ring protein FliF